MRIVAIDFETASALPDSPCAVGFAVIEGERVVHRDYHLIRPREMRFDLGNIRVHGIRPADVKDARAFPEVMADFVSHMEGALVVAHNAGFDCRVLAATAKAYRMALPAHSSLCTVALGRRLWPEEPSHRLSALSAKLGIRFRHHHAGEDAFACATIAIEGARQAGAGCVADLARAMDLARDRPALSAPRAGGIADRALRSLDPRLRAMPGVGAAPARAQDEAAPRVTVRGSRGALYDLGLERDRASGAMRLSCTCMSARFRPVCKHAAALMDGDISAVADPAGADEAERLIRRLAS